MRKNNDILELIEDLEKKLVLTYPELINKGDELINNPPGYTYLCSTFLLAAVFKKFVIQSQYVSTIVEDVDRTMEDDGVWNLLGLFSKFITIPFYITSFFLLILLYLDKSAVKKGDVDANDLKEIKQYLKEVLDIKDYDIRFILLKNLQELKNILEQRDISEEESKGF